LVFLFISSLHHLPWLQHGLNVPCAKCQVHDSSPLSQSSIHYVPRLIIGFRNNFFYRVRSLASRPTPNLKDQRIPFCQGHHLRPVQQGWPYQQLMLTLA
jgi:hypothetical protein